MEGRKPAVPKFGSFKPKVEEPPKPPASKPEKRHDGDGDGGEREDPAHHRSSQSKSRSRSQHRNRHHHRDRKPSRSPERHRPEPTPRDHPLYVVDKRGDPLIVRYGANERSKVPAYRRSGAGRVMGAKGRLRFVYDGSKELFSLGEKSSEGPSAFRDRAILSKAARKKTRVFRLRAEPEQAQSVTGELDFLPLSDSRKPRRPKVDEYEIPGGEEPNYRSIQGKAKARDFVDSDLESAASSDAEAEEELDSSSPTRKEAIELSRLVKENPSDTRAWLHLVDLQEDLLRLNQDARHDKTNDEVKGLASMRVSLLEEALPHAQTEADKEKLFLRLMREGSRVWSSKVLAKRWAEADLQNSSLAMWRAHLAYELSNVTTFTYDGVKQLHVQRLQRLGQRLLEQTNNASAAYKDRQLDEICRTQSDVSDNLCNTCDELVHVFLRMTCLIREAGYLELAVAAWQALLELTFARPTDESVTDAAELMLDFRDFWESEVPRIGENGANGWRHFTEAEEMADLPEARTEVAPALPATKDVYKAWAAVEMQKSRNAMLPARTLDEGTEEDPFRVVMIADLEPLLFVIPSAVNILPRVKAAVLSGFLLFCGLPAPSLDVGDKIHELRSDPFLDHESARLERTGSRPDSDTGDEGRKPPEFSGPGHRFAETPDVLFSGPNWFGFFHPYMTPTDDLALLATTQLATSFGYEPIAEYSMGLAWRKSPGAIRKTAKALLKKWPNNTSLYNAYAVAEWRNGNQAVARNVLLSATSQDLEGKDRLWTTWAWLDVEAGDMNGALSRCIAAAGTSTEVKTNATYSQLLKSRQTLSSSREFLLSVGDIYQATLHAETSLLLDYLSPYIGLAEPTSSQQGDIQEAMTTVKVFTSEAVARGHGRSTHVERLLQAAAHLLYLHATRGAFRPTHLREQLRGFLSLFPSNTIFLSLFAWADTMVVINDPVRELLRTHVLARAHDCLSSRLFAIRHEMRAGSAHSVRVAFERALDADGAGHGCAGLWRSYVRFCAGNKRGLRGGAGGSGLAKEVYFRAIAACPWSKALAMEAFTTLVGDGAGHLDSGELQSVWVTMADKGLRVHVDVEEFRADWAKRGGRRGVGGQPPGKPPV